MLPFVLFALSIGALIATPAIARTMAGRASRHDVALFNAAPQEWLRVEERGPEIGRAGAQPIFAWLRVATSDGQDALLYFNATTQPKVWEREVALQAGVARYAGIVARDRVAQKDLRLAPATKDVRNPSHGFSLIELLIVVAIIGILAAIALPMYGTYVAESALKPVQVAMLETAQSLEQYAQDHNTYVGGCANLPAVANAQINCSLLSATSYNIQAQGTGSLSGLIYTLDQAGARSTPSAPASWQSNATCWVAGPDGACA